MTYIQFWRFAYNCLQHRYQWWLMQIWKFANCLNLHVFVFVCVTWCPTMGHIGAGPLPVMTDAMSISSHRARHALLSALVLKSFLCPKSLASHIWLVFNSSLRKTVNPRTIITMHPNNEKLSSSWPLYIHTIRLGCSFHQYKTKALKLASIEQDERHVVTLRGCVTQRGLRLVSEPGC